MTQLKSPRKGVVAWSYLETFVEQLFGFVKEGSIGAAGVHI